MKWEQVCLPSVTSALFCGLYTGCSTFTTQTTYAVHQSAIVPGATAPLMAGPAPQAGKWMLSASGQGGLHGVGIASASRGNTGSIVADTGGRLAVGYSGTWWGLAGGLDLLPRSLMHATTSETNDGRFANDLVVMPTLALHLRKVESETFELGFNIETSLAMVPYTRSVDITTVVTSGGRSDSPSFSQSAENGYAPLFTVRAGPSFGWHLGHGIGLSAGFLVGNEPFVQGEVTVSQTCVTQGLRTDCTGSTSEDVLIVDQAIAFTPYLSPSVTLGPVQLLANLHGNVSSNSALMQAAPGGGELQVRLLF